MSRRNNISQVQYDIESICRCYVASKTSYYYYILYYIMIKIEFIIMTDRYYVSCHVKVLHPSNFLRETLLPHILL